MRNEERVKDTHEVFTPRSLVRDMLSRLPPQVWFDPNKRWLEPAAGDGNFLVEIKARLIQAGHDERHVLNHQLFSIELLDDNHYVLQLRLGYLQERDGFLVPGPALQDDLDLFTVSKMDRRTQDLNHFSPYAGKTVLYNGEPYTLERDEVYHHVNHRCASALDGLEFPGARTVTGLPLLPERELGEWPDTDTPEIGQPTVVSELQALWHVDTQRRGPTTKEVVTSPEKVSTPKRTAEKITAPREPKPPKPPKPDTKGGGWQVKAEWVGQDKVIRCKAPYDGSYWECDHDALVNAINASLAAKGKPLIGEPGPSEKSYGASGGLREPQLWTRVT